MKITEVLLNLVFLGYIALAALAGLAVVSGWWFIAASALLLTSFGIADFLRWRAVR